MKTIPTTPPVVCDSSQTHLRIYAPIPGTHLNELLSKYFDLRENVRDETESLIERIRTDHFPFCSKEELSYIASDAAEEGGIIAVLPQSSEDITPDLSIWYPMPIANDASASDAPLSDAPAPDAPASGTPVSFDLVEGSSTPVSFDQVEGQSTPVSDASPSDANTLIAYAPRCRATYKYMPISYADKHFNDKQWSWKPFKYCGIHIYYYKDIAHLISPQNQSEISTLLRNNVRPKSKLAYGIHYTDIDPEYLTFKGQSITEPWDPDRAIQLYGLFSDNPSVMSSTLLKLLKAHRPDPLSSTTTAPVSDASPSDPIPTPIFEHAYSPSLSTYIFRTNLQLDPSLQDITDDPDAQRLFAQD